jgi:hypothetical protein
LWPLMGRHLVVSRITSLKARQSAFSRTCMRLVASVRSRTPAKIDSMGLEVRRWSQCSSG